MGFIDDRVLPRNTGPAILIPDNGTIGHHGLRHRARIVSPIEGEIAARATVAIAEVRFIQGKAAGKFFGVGIDQKLVGIEAESTLRLIGPVDAIAIELTGANFVEIAVPDVLGPLRQGQADELVGAVRAKQAELDLFGMRGE